jgi:serine/threonine protein kinase
MTERRDPVETPAEAYCPACNKSYPPEAETCPDDRTTLVRFRAERDELIGRVLDDRFEVRTPLGKGGMGTVYVALQRSVDREVAIKIVHPRLADRQSAKRFLREARLASRLSQTNIVHVIDFGQTEDGVLYLVMELLRGKTLAFHIATTRFTLRRIIGIIVQLCDALEAAHAQGIIHRDLKPGNVVILDEPRDRDHVKVLDFGLAKSLAGDAATSVTTTDAIIGTPLYMSPEQVQGRPSDPRSDLYAVGCILYEMLAGKPPFSDQTVNVIMAQHLIEPPPPLPPAVPPGMRALVERLLAKKPDDRLGSAGELREAIVQLEHAGSGADLDHDTVIEMPRHAPDSDATTHEKRIAGFDIIRRIGRGGMGEVFEAVRVGPGGFRRPVALKRLARDAAIRGDTIQRFLAEAAVLARLDHPNVIDVHEVIAGDDGYIIVMELLRGESFLSVVRGAHGSGGIAVAEVLAVADQALAGLAHVHGARGDDGRPLGLIHRDVTPGNLFVTDGGVVKLLDFGIAKLRDAADALVTRVGEVHGTFELIAPEQARGEQADVTTDLYQLAGTMYWALTGQFPHGTGSAPELLARAASEMPRSIRALRPDLPAPVVAVIEQAMAPDRRHRFPTADAMRSAIASLLAPRTQTAPALAARVEHDLAASIATRPGSLHVALSPPPMPAPSAPFDPRVAQPSMPAVPAPPTGVVSHAPPRRSRTGLVVAASLAVVAGVAIAVVIAVSSSSPSPKTPEPAATAIDAAMPAVVVDAAVAEPAVSIDAAPVAIDAPSRRDRPDARRRDRDRERDRDPPSSPVDAAPKSTPKQPDAEPGMDFIKPKPQPKSPP